MEVKDIFNIRFRFSNEYDISLTNYSSAFILSVYREFELWA